jgi:hypothetical protein
MLWSYCRPAPSNPAADQNNGRPIPIQRQSGVLLGMETPFPRVLAEGSESFQSWRRRRFLIGDGEGRLGASRGRDATVWRVFSQNCSVEVGGAEHKELIHGWISIQDYTGAHCFRENGILGPFCLPTWNNSLGIWCSLGGTIGPIISLGKGPKRAAKTSNLFPIYNNTFKSIFLLK